MGSTWARRNPGRTPQDDHQASEAPPLPYPKVSQDPAAGQGMAPPSGRGITWACPFGTSGSLEPRSCRLALCWSMPRPSPELTGGGRGRDTLVCPSPAALRPRVHQSPTVHTVSRPSVVCPSVCPSVVHPPIHPSSVYAAISPSVHQTSVHPPIIRLSIIIYVFTHLPSICPSVCPSIHYLSLCTCCLPPSTYPPSSV